MPFKKGQRHPNQGGPQKGSGRPTNEKRAKDLAAAEIVQRELEKDIGGSARHYLKRSRKNDKVLMHLIDKFMPAAKQELQISGGLKIVRVDAFDPSKVK